MKTFFLRLPPQSAADFHHSDIFFPGSLQATRALMIVGIIVSIAGLGVACMGMKCTTCGGNDKLRKSRVAMTGGIILLVGGEDASAQLLVQNLMVFTAKSNAFSPPRAVCHRGVLLVRT